MHYQFDPVQTTKPSVIGANNVLGLAKQVKARILQASTSEVYGDLMVHPLPEEYWGDVKTGGTRSKLISKPLSSDDPQQRRPDILKGKDVLGWKPKIQLRERLICAVAYFERVLSDGKIPALTARHVN